MYDVYTRPDELGLEEEENPFLRRPAFAPYGPLVQPPVVQVPPTTPIEQGLDVLPWDVQPPAPPAEAPPVGLDALPEDVEPPSGGLNELPEGVEPPWFGKRKAEIDPTKYDTKLTPEQETQFQDWKTKNAPQDSGEDYDLRGAFKAGIVADPETGHMPDRWKKPNHPTFSVESRYAEGANKELAGTWDKDGNFIPPEPKPSTLGAVARMVEPEAGSRRAEFGDRIKRGVRTGTEEVKAGVNQMSSGFLSAEQNPYVGKSVAEAKTDIPKLEAQILETEKGLKAAGVDPSLAGMEWYYEVAPEQREQSQRLSGLRTQLMQAKQSVTGPTTESFAGTLSRSFADVAEANRDRGKEIKEEYKDKIQESRNGELWMSVADSIGASAPSMGASMLNPAFGLALMYSQTFESSRAEFLEKGGDPAKADEYGHTQAASQIPWEIFGEVALANLAKGTLKRLVGNADSKAWSTWIKERAVDLFKTAGGEVGITTPAQTEIEQEIGEVYGVKPKMTPAEKAANVWKNMQVAGGQTLLLAGGPTVVEAGHRVATQAAQQPGAPAPVAPPAVPPEGAPAPPIPPTPPEAFAPPAAPGVTVEPAPSMEVPITPEVRQGLLAQAPPPAPAIAPEIQEGLLRRQLTEIDQTLDQTVDHDQRAPLVLQRAQIETKLLAKQAVDTTKQQVENLQASNAPKTAEALAATTKEGIDQASVRLDQMITEMTPAGTFAEEEAAPTGEERFAPPPPAPAAVSQPAPGLRPIAPEVPPIATGGRIITPEMRQIATRPGQIPPEPRLITPETRQIGPEPRLVTPAGRPITPTIQQVVPERVIGQRPQAPGVTAQLPVQAPVPPTAIVPTQPGEEVVTRPGIKGQEAVVARPSEMIAGPLKGVTVNVEGIAPNGDRVTTQQDATDALMEAKKDRTAFQLLLDCLT